MIGHLKLLSNFNEQRVLCLIMITQIVTSVPSTTWSKYYKIDSKRLQTTYKKVESVSRIECCAICEQEDSCNSVAYRESTGSCQLSTLPLEDIDTNSELAAGWVTLGKVVTPGWILLFQAVADIGPDPYDAWMFGTDVTSNDTSCMGSDVTSCSKHFRSVFVDLWNVFGEFEVKLSLFKDQSEAAYITFNGTGSNLEDWFTLDKVLNSSWTVLHDPIEYFTMKGAPEVERRFCIVHSWDGCPNDPSLLVVKNPGGVCTYDTQPSYPRFLYSVSNSWANFYNPSEYDFADSMRISVRLL